MPSECGGAALMSHYVAVLSCHMYRVFHSCILSARVPSTLLPYLEEKGFLRFFPQLSSSSDCKMHFAVAAVPASSRGRDHMATADATTATPSNAQKRVIAITTEAEDPVIFSG